MLLDADYKDFNIFKIMIKESVKKYIYKSEIINLESRQNNLPTQMNQN